MTALSEHTLFADIETYSSADLARGGVRKYAEAPDFDILLMSYAWDDEPVRVWDFTADGPPPWLREALLDETVLENFGVEVDGNVEADFEQFETIIDILGGVDVEMSKGEAQYMKYVMESGDMREGENHLSGKQALDFARMRGLDDDFHRTERQRRLLTRLAQKLQSASAQQLLDMVNEVLPHVSTDMSSTQMLGYAASAIQVYLSGAEITAGRIPAEGMYSDAEIRGMQVLVPNLEKCQQYLSELVYGAAQAEE